MAGDPDPRLERQLDYLMAIEPLKRVERRSPVLETDRRENSAEHSWHVALAAWLLDQGADVNAVNRFGHQPLHNAARHGRTSVVALLLERGAALNARAGADETALHLAVKRERLDTARLLLDRNADRTMKNKDGRTAADIASATKRQDLIALFG